VDIDEDMLKLKKFFNAKKGLIPGNYAS